MPSANARSGAGHRASGGVSHAGGRDRSTPMRYDEGLPFRHPAEVAEEMLVGGAGAVTVSAVHMV